MEIVALVVGAAVAAAIAPSGLRALPTRPNWLDRELPFPAGAVAAVAAILALGVLAAAQAVLEENVLGDSAGPVALLCLGVAFLGLTDDMFSGASRGWRGHAGAVARGEVSTGALKALGTLALATAVLAGGEWWVISVVLVAATTNLFNILDLRPGRSAKVFAVLALGLVIAGEWRRELGFLAGPVLVLGAYDLRMRAMLGDTGSNLIGALAGAWLALALGPGGEAVALAIVLAVTLYGELRSITRTVERIPLLRALDELGRPQDARSSQDAAGRLPTLKHPDRDA